MASFLQHLGNVFDMYSLLGIGVVFCALQSLDLKFGNSVYIICDQVLGVETTRVIANG